MSAKTYASVSILKIFTFLIFQIRSKNLDVLFRKDYYAQRTLSAATTSSSAVSSEQGEPPEDPDSIPVSGSNPEQPVVPEEEEEEEDGDEEEEDDTYEVKGEETNIKESSTTANKVKEAYPEKNPEKNPESKNPDNNKKSTSVINTNATPFYPASYVPVPPPMPPSTYMPPVSSGGVSRPNLFLYSPSSNTMIPCEEIIIPNAVVPGQEVYQGPSNIYLAFPMEQNGGGGTGVPPPGGTSTTPNNSTVAAVTSCGNSTNSTPPQAQSPQTSSSATGEFQKLSAVCLLLQKTFLIPSLI